MSTDTTNSDHTVICNTQSKTTSKRAKVTKTSSSKYINNVDGLGNYIRFVFTSKTLEEANSILHDLYQNHVIDWSYVHAYTRHRRTEGGQTQYFSNHGIAHVIHPSANYSYFRNRIPKMSFKLSFYPDREYPVFNNKNNETKMGTEVLQSGQVFCNPPHNSGCYNEIPVMEGDTQSSLLVF